MLIALDDVTISTPDGEPLLRTGKQFVRQGDRIVVLGRNGVGKSRLISLLKAAIMGEEPKPDGIRVTPSVVLGHADQALADIDDGDTPLAAIKGRFKLGEQGIHGLLSGAGIGMDMQTRPVAALSGGQKARLAMLILRLAQPNSYLLDEPTNHLDIEGQEALEAEIVSGQISCILVSHDRAFVNAVGNRFWRIEKRRLVEMEDAGAFFKQGPQ